MKYHHDKRLWHLLQQSVESIKRSSTLSENYTAGAVSAPHWFVKTSFWHFLSSHLNCSSVSCLVLCCSRAALSCPRFIKAPAWDFGSRFTVSSILLPSYSPSSAEEWFNATWERTLVAGRKEETTRQHRAAYSPNANRSYPVKSDRESQQQHHWTADGADMSISAE